MVTVRSEAALPASVETTTGSTPLIHRLRSYLPRGNLLDDLAWRQRHLMLQWLLFLHAPGLFLFGLWRGTSPLTCALVISPSLVLLAVAAVIRQRRVASFFTTAGLVYCSSALVGLSGGSIEAHFHFFVLIGFIALYQDWVPFMWNIVFTVLSHGIGSAWKTTLIFNTASGQTNPWLWSLIHGLAVLAACVGMVIFWRTSEDEQEKALAFRQQLSAAEINQRKFTAELLVNLARRNQGMLYRQLDIINQLENQEQDPDALAELFRLDHLATRIRRNAESLLVLSGEDPPRVWSEPVRLLDVVRAAIAETEDLQRVVFVVDEHLTVLGHTVTGLTHLLAELTENAVRSSPPQMNVTIRTRPDPRVPGTYVLTVEDWGLGMPAQAMAEANDVLAEPREVDLSASQRLGFHVISRLAQRLGVRVSLTPTADSGVTAVVVLPPGLFPTRPSRSAGTLSVLQPTGEPGWQLPRRVPMATRAGAVVPTASPGAQPTASPGAEPTASPDAEPLAPQWPGRPPVPAYSAQAAAPSPPPVAPGWPGRPPAPAYSEEPIRPAEPGRPSPWVLTGHPGPGSVGPPVPTAATAEPSASLTSGVVLSRRTPQAHLAPQLRAPDRPSVSAAVLDPERARDALSRYQASREAALSDGAASAGHGGFGPDGAGQVS